MKIRLFFFVFLVLMSVSCYAAYTGIYFLDRTERPRTVRFRDIESQISYVLVPFGFRQVKLPKEIENLGPIFSHNKKYGDKDLMKLSGTGAKISVAVSFRGPSITIRDASNDKETEFIRAIKDAIEQRLKAHYRVKKLKFEEQLNIL